MSSILLLIFAVIKKKKRLFFYFYPIFLLFIGISGFIIYNIARKTYDKITNSFKPRSGEEIYNAIFCRDSINCSKIIYSHDQVIPKIDYAIFLYFETCPNETKRILQQNKYTETRIATKGLNLNEPNANNNWFKPETLGDSVLYFEFSQNNGKRIQIVYVSLDSTKVYYKDIAD